ncbi:MAG: hypothetical protein RLZZ587_654, partial [Actinomycetota bacterium]
FQREVAIRVNEWVIHEVPHLHSDRSRLWWIGDSASLARDPKD